MIRYLRRKEINIEKYDSCIQSAFNSRVYAFSWYLDIVADNWDALILNDYEAVMPLPWRKKFFIKYMYPPAWTQQLGVFSTYETPEGLIFKFIKAIPKKFKKVTIQFNSENKFQHKNITERINYILPLNKSYNDLYKGFNTNRKRDLKKTNTDFIFNKNVSINVFFLLIENIENGYKLNEYQVSVLRRLLPLENVRIYGIEVNQKIISCTLWLKDSHRLTYLFSASCSKGKELGAQTRLIVETIKLNEKSDLFLDFEGSMIKGVADFYKSFKAKEEIYFTLQTSSILKNLF